MGATLSNISTSSKNSSENPWDNLPDKNTNWAVPETIFDSLPEWKEDNPPINPLRIDMNKLISISKQVLDSERTGETLSENAQTELKAEAALLLSGLHDHRTIILSMSPEQASKHKALLSAWHPFLSQNDLQKKMEFEASRSYRLHHPERPSKTAPGAEDFSSGYYQVHFDNRNNFRDEEWRNIWITYGSDLYRSERDWPSESLHQATAEMSLLLWDASVAFLLLIEIALSLPRGHLLNCIVDDPSSSSIDFNKSSESNFAIIHYYDNVEGKKVKKIYDGPQRCMAHRDSGFITLLPRATEPGIQALCTGFDSAGSAGPGCWVDMEKYTQDNEVIVFTGRMLEIKTEGRVRPLIHRVVRYPGLERLSSPFEAKPSSKAIIIEIEKEVEGENRKQKEAIDADTLEKAMSWDRLQRLVLRADGVHPAEHSSHLNGSYAPLLILYGDTLVVNE
eukprot:TRINITY_DN1768_c0_g1_i1.p1 TRINITY_DN1768_c0_g1~~TRINITY_DN1768_c0_g1_i1.p1  ORF type:complete len:450 (-),score=99.94 TRINITY_DN1768_c0_g1_i1:109-1458(-)